MFIDRAKIQVIAGSGGNGMSSFRREKFVAKGGPNGGDGGRGGDVILVVDAGMNTLLDFRYKRKFKADRGGDGEKNTMHGASAKPIYIKVPQGTLVKNAATDEVMADLTVVGQELVIAKGGRGGRGNARFPNSINRAPMYAENGEPGESFELLLELKLLADVGLVGYPSVGKSSLITMVSAARPEVAAYHFTTLVPVLGVVSLDKGHSFVMADIPGLIEGASEGVGLGHAFLRHVERTKVIIHVLDASGMEGRDPLEDYEKINKELALYNKRLATRPQIVAANKMDIPEAQENFARIEEYMKERGVEVFPISAATGDGLKALMERVSVLLSEYVEEVETTDEEAVRMYQPEDEHAIKITRDDTGAFIVSGRYLERKVAMTKFNNAEAVRRFQVYWKKSGIEAAIKARGIKEGDTVRIGEMEFEYRE